MEIKMGDIVEYKGEIWEVGFVNNNVTGWAGTLRLQKNGEAGAKSINHINPENIKIIRKRQD